MKKIKLTMKELKANKYTLVVYIDKERVIKTQYVVNVKQKSITKILESLNYKILYMKQITYKEYLRNNMEMDEIIVLKQGWLLINFWQSERIDMVFDKLFNDSFVDYYVHIESLQEIIDIKDIDVHTLMDYTVDRDKLRLLLESSGLLEII